MPTISSPSEFLEEIEDWSWDKAAGNNLLLAQRESGGKMDLDKKSISLVNNFSLSSPLSMSSS